MKMKSLTLIAVLFLCFVSDSANAQSNELLTRVTGEELASVRTANDWFLRKHLYIARQHEIVKVDTDLLMSGQPFTIQLGPNDSITVDPNDVNTLGSGAGIVWTGKISNPDRTIDDLMTELGSRRQAEIAHDSIYGVTITGSRAEVEAGTGINIPIFLETEQRAMRPEFRGSGNSANWFYRYRTVITSPNSKNTYSLSALEMGGPYHIIKELDPEKMMRPGRAEDSPDPNEAQKRQDYQNFLDSLGEDPRKALRRHKEMEDQQ